MSIRSSENLTVRFYMSPYQRWQQRLKNRRKNLK
ncbi:hypothetical protein DVH24_022254 [Malus domestica]|uniref:Uncharacterized protein n=1 Tax=Malus domestica TaxID=3750 RepID=A0A498KR16_MALDO|nr:hypothetical protein DVH24_022254 [Malus domestica]